MKVFKLPDLGEGLDEAEIVSWHVSAGDHVVAEQPIVAVETAKAVVEIPSPRSGRVSLVHARVGDVVKIGSPLVTFEDEAIAQHDIGTVVAELPGSEVEAQRPSPEAKKHSGDKQASDTPLASPAVRQLARSLGLNLTAIEGTGPRGSITRRDVERVSASGQSGFEPLSGVRRAMALNMGRSAREVPGSTVLDEVDVGHWPADADVTRRLIVAVVAACKKAPGLNAWFNGDLLERKLLTMVNIGIAISGRDGLFVPVLRHAEQLASEELREHIEKIKEAVDARNLLPEDMAGASISLSNFGMLGGLFASLAIVPPQVAILGAGRIFEAVRPIDGEPRLTRILPLSLSFDHRVVTGAEAVTFINAAIASLAAKDDPASSNDEL